jgi:hypothetical protein
MAGHFAGGGGKDKAAVRNYAQPLDGVASGTNNPIPQKFKLRRRSNGNFDVQYFRADFHPSSERAGPLHEEGAGRLCREKI